MKKNQILSESSVFEGYEIIAKLSTHHDGEREVYKVGFDESHTGVLTLFDIRCDRYAHESVSKNEILNSIMEIRFLRENEDLEGIAKVLDYGVDVYAGHSYAWIVQEYIHEINLHEFIENYGMLSEKDGALVAKKVGAIVEKIARFTGGGGHYNITPANILVKIEEGEFTDAYLIGFSNIGPSYSGNTPIDIRCIDKRFRTPESVKGIFNIKSDIYSLGMATLAVATGYPEKIESKSLSRDSDEEIEIERIPFIDIHKAMWKKGDEIIKSALRMILKKATAVYPANRFNSMEKFMEFVARFDCRYERSEQAQERKKEENLTKEETRADMTANDYKPTKAKEGFDSVAGMDDLKKLFRRDFISIVKNPDIASAYGIKPSNCTLLYGPQGCGKTYIAEKAAQEAGLKYKIVKPSDLGSIYIHGAQEKIAATFDEAQKEGPIILIFDEFDALVPKRSASDPNDCQAMEVNELLTQLNNCAERGIYCLCTTNRPDKIDPAVMRKGRVDRSIFISLPDFDARKELFRLTLDRRPTDDSIDCEQLASATDKYTCSDITYIVEETARVCFEETVDQKLSDPIKITQERLLKVAHETTPSVTEKQLKEYLEMKAKMENKEIEMVRKRVGFAVGV